MKTIMIVMAKGFIVRSILRSGALRELTCHGHRVVIVFLNAFNKPIPPSFFKEFSSPQVTLEAVLPPRRSWLKRKFYRVFHFFSDFVVYNYSDRYIRHVKNNTNPIIFQLIRFFRSILSQPSFLKRFARWIELRFFTENVHASLFDKYQPDLVFSTSIIAGFDLEFLNEARQRGIKTVAMPRGWDNVTTKFYRHLPDKLIVQNPEMLKQAIRSQAIPRDRIVVTGFPQFDWYRRPEILLSRQEFCQRLGLNPKHKIIFWGSSGKWTPDDGNIAQTLITAIKQNQLVMPASLIIRAHFSDAVTHRFDSLADGKTVFVDNNYHFCDFFRDNWDPTIEETILFTNMIYHSDVIVSLCSTLVLDALSADKPIINTVYKNFHDSRGRDVSFLSYTRDFYAPLIEEKAIDLVKSEKELVTSLNFYLKNPQAKQNNRARARERLCYKADGQASQRLAAVLMSL